MYFAAVFASGLQWYVASNTRIALCSNSGLLPFLFICVRSVLASVWSGTKWHQVAHSVLASIWSGTKWHTHCHHLALIGSEWHQVAHWLSPSGTKSHWVAPSGTLTATKWQQSLVQSPRALDHILSILRWMNMPYLRTKWRWVALSGTKWRTHCHQVAAKSGPEPVLSEGLGG